MHQKDENLTRVTDLVRAGEPNIRVVQSSGAARAYFLAALFTEIRRPCLVVFPTAKEAARFVRELEFFLPESSTQGAPGERRLYDFPAYDVTPLAGVSPHREIVSRRIEGLYALMSEQNAIVVTSVEAFRLRILPKESLKRAVEYLEPEEEVSREGLIRRLEASGYLRTSLVEEKGDYSIRGGVIDVFPPLYTDPIRIEFWGDRMESIRHFDPLSQRSTRNLKEAVILPAGEIIFEPENVQRARSMGRLPGLISEITSFPGQEAWLNHFYARPDKLFDYLPKEGLLILMENRQILAEMDNFGSRFMRDVERYRLEAEENKTPFPEIESVLIDTEEIKEALSSFQRLQFTEVDLESREESSPVFRIAGDLSIQDDLAVTMEGRGRVSMAPFANRLSGWIQQGARVVLVCRTEQQANRLREILKNYEVTAEEMVQRWSDVSPGRGITICMGRLTKGFAWPELGLYVISEDEIFGTKRPRSKAKAGDRKPSWTSLSQIGKGDLVVHEEHGIGRYGGMCKMEVEQKANDFIIVEYAQNDRLYVPADRISILQKYVGPDDGNPMLDQLGGRSWDVAKQKAKKSIREIAKQLVDTYAIRKYRKGFAYSGPDHVYREFEAAFEHEETPDQVKAIDDVLGDMESERPMDRLVCGDVGFGKTEVAIRAAFKAVMDGKQVAVLVPTTVLAEQHYETFSRRMSLHPIRIGVLSRFKTRAEQKEILAKVRAGRIDILIGTHRLLQADVAFKELGLLVVDEEQRFGVKQKEALKKYRALIDVLALTATPIPRTLQISLFGIRDLSVIETPPEERLAIQTHLCPFEENTIAHAIESELERGGQVFFVQNRVQTIEAMARKLKEVVPKATFAVAHGQMKEKDLENTMVRFLRREVDVLVCTTIIESGLDIPSVNTIIINEVDRFGLSQIYQLRGRVGRSSEMAYAYLLVSPEGHLTRDAEKRLRALMEFSHLGAGIQLAMHDLKIRGGGNILGFSQTGHISAIGYELYLKLVEQAVAEIKGEEWHDEINPEINVNIPAYLPSDYIVDADLRLNLYRRLSSLREEPDLDAIQEEMNDRFGPFPKEAANLMQVMAVRLLLKKRGILRLDVNHEGLILTFSPDTDVRPDVLIRQIAAQPRKFQFLSDRKVKIKTRIPNPLEGLAEAKRAIAGLIGSTA
ncbi:MAG: transcription-repair coupling factor [Deltaproteobacteria bacterium HGW-Deltaproteobacteria-15]|jgi:transcription-repair coupling factor (superfamily II helicase)|nr:MAG: transcription-repair coupling factor [Deltaproteobacteria bacterium HGW-Deltaproteobacteria-15]